VPAEWGCVGGWALGLRAVRVVFKVTIGDRVATAVRQKHRAAEVVGVVGFGGAIGSNFIFNPIGTPDVAGAVAFEYAGEAGVGVDNVGGGVVLHAVAVGVVAVEGRAVDSSEAVVGVVLVAYYGGAGGVGAGGHVAVGVETHISGVAVPFGKAVVFVVIGGVGFVDAYGGAGGEGDGAGNASVEVVFEGAHPEEGAGGVAFFDHAELAGEVVGLLAGGAVGAVGLHEASGVVVIVGGFPVGVERVFHGFESVALVVGVGDGEVVAGIGEGGQVVCGVVAVGDGVAFAVFVFPEAAEGVVGAGGDFVVFSDFPEAASGVVLHVGGGEGGGAVGGVNGLGEDAAFGVERGVFDDFVGGADGGVHEAAEVCKCGGSYALEGLFRGGGGDFEGVVVVVGGGVFVAEAVGQGGLASVGVVGGGDGFAHGVGGLGGEEAGVPVVGLGDRAVGGDAPDAVAEVVVAEVGGAVEGVGDGVGAAGGIVGGGDFGAEGVLGFDELAAVVVFVGGFGAVGGGEFKEFVVGVVIVIGGVTEGVDGAGFLAGVVVGDLGDLGCLAAGGDGDGEGLASEVVGVGGGDAGAVGGLGDVAAFVVGGGFDGGGVGVGCLD